MEDAGAGAVIPTVVVPDSVRKSRLEEAIQLAVLGGGRIEAQGEFYAVMRFGKPVNHVLHLLLTLTLTLVTLGMFLGGVGGIIWVLVWIILTIRSAITSYAKTLSIDEYGALSSERS